MAVVVVVVDGVTISSPPSTAINAMVPPSRASCRKVLYLEMVVGRTSADGRLKSQKRRKVLGAGREM